MAVPVDRMDLRLPRLSRWRLLLLPFSLSYTIIIGFRNLLYDAGLLKAKALARPTIAVGNITTGGTGKTPLVQALANHFLQSKRTAAILSRGYKSDAESTGVVFRSDSSSNPTQQQVGDEIAMLARKLPGVWFGVGADRSAMAKKVALEGDPALYLLDDGFQRRDVARDLNIVVVDASNPFGNRYCVPAGILREPLAELRRADLIVLTRCETVSQAQLDLIERQILAKNEAVRIVRTTTRIEKLRRLHGEGELPPAAAVWAMAALGNPYGFEYTIARAGLKLSGTTWFRDHHRFRDEEVQEVEKRARTAGASAVVVTEKDAVKLSPSHFREMPCYVLEIGIDFGDQADIFWGIIDEVVPC